MHLDKHRFERFARRILLVLFSVFCLLSAKAEFRTWKDKNGNSIQAEFVNTFGGQIVLKDQKGKVYRLDPDKLSKEDQLYLNPLPPRYGIFLSKTSKQQQSPDEDLNTLYKTSSFQYDFKLRVEFLTDDPVPEGLGGALFIMGEDEKGTMLVLEKVDGRIKKSEWGKGDLKGTGCELTSTRNKDGKMVQGVKYKGHLIMLLASDGTILEKQASHSFLTDNPEKTLTLFVGDTFNRKLEKL